MTLRFQHEGQIDRLTSPWLECSVMTSQNTDSRNDVDLPHTVVASFLVSLPVCPFFFSLSFGMPLFEPMGDLRTSQAPREKEINPRVRRESGHDPVRQARWCYLNPLTIQGDRDSTMYFLRTETRSVGSCRERMRRRLGGWGKR